MLQKFYHLPMKKRLSVSLLFLVIIVLLGVTVIYFAAQYSQKIEAQRYKECVRITNKTQALQTKAQLKKAYGQLKDKQSQCSNQATVNDKLSKQASKKEVTKTIKKAQFTGELAKAAYVAGDKDQAKKYAAEANKLDGQLSPRQLQAMPDDEKTQFFSDQYGISSDTYYFQKPIQVKVKQ